VPKRGILTDKVLSRCGRGIMYEVVEARILSRVLRDRRGLSMCG